MERWHHCQPGAAPKATGLAQCPERALAGVHYFLLPLVISFQTIMIFISVMLCISFSLVFVYILKVFHLWLQWSLYVYLQLYPLILNW